MPWLDKHTFPRLARSTLNELHQNQHEKASLVCVRVQSPSGLALVPCALSMVDLSGNYDVESQKNVLFWFLAPYSYDPLWRGFFAWRQKTASVASLPRPCLIITVIYFTQFIYIPDTKAVNIVIIIGIFNLIELKYVFSTPAIPGRHPIPQDRATAPSPTHTAALAIPCERTGVVAKLGERRVFKVALRKTASNHYFVHFMLAQP